MRFKALPNELLAGKAQDRLSVMSIEFRLVELAG